ncbi:class I SAM-dependent methyltransferase [Maridesulfovibrio ferrireducens]|uniref:class I SAM-dependent methyltransferase n=1 Tax=Maridesulfovibrio ferrireducens TaxID=246191 RepID=UPI001A19F3F9|nr:class I SAM-dependent methyltransferase [Maridesulfovibrio ferrireducens]MBI9109626.1 methyltransferase domain-containing protein [Maridesulfovibrio ferrireducens]
MDKPIILIQAASRAWSGAPDWCMNEIDGRPVVALTVENALNQFPDAKIYIVAPAFDKGGRLDDLPSMFPAHKIEVFYGFDDSPLERMINALQHVPDETLFVRVDGLHFGWLPEHAAEMLKIAEQNHLDCIKMEDDFPIQLTADIYRLSGLKKVISMLKYLPEAGVFKVHPKFFMFSNSADFKCERFKTYSPVSDEWLKKCREIAHGVYVEGRMQVSNKNIKTGDQLRFHYELALDFINPGMTVLDCACGPGYGARMLAEKATHVIAADLDETTVSNAAAETTQKNLTFKIGDATAFNCADQTFDAITSFETVEHVDPAPYFKEMFRILKPGGRLILSTPQNSLGHIPVNSQHLREFSLEEITNLCSEHFEIEKIIGIKQGRVVFPNDHKGQNTFMVCKKPE